MQRIVSFSSHDTVEKKKFQVFQTSNLSTLKVQINPWFSSAKDVFYVIVRSFPFVCETEAAMEASTSTAEAVSEAIVLYVRPPLYALETTTRSITT